MGKAKDGIFGPVNGKVKNLIFYTAKGINIIRSVGEKKNIIPSEALKRNNSNFAVLVKFLKKVKPFIRAGFKKEAIGSVYSYHNLATSWNLKNAMRNESGISEIMFDKLLLSRGNCLPPDAAQVSLQPGGLSFTWNATALPYAPSQDRAMLLAYFPELQEAIMNTDGAKRMAGSDFLALQPSYLQEAMEVYIAFKATDSDDVSYSQYLGRIHQPPG